MPETRSECLARGMDDYLAKPARKEKIMAVFERYLGIKRSDGKARGNGIAESSL